MATEATPATDRSGTIFALVWYLLLAAGGVWLVVKFGGSAGLVKSSLHALGYGLAGPGVWMVAREFRRLFEPEVVADIEAEEAERAKRDRERQATLVSVVCFWLLNLLLIGGFVAYLLDDSGLHGEKTLFITLVFAGVTLSSVVCAIEATVRWWHRQKARSQKPAAESA